MQQQKYFLNWNSYSNHLRSTLHSMLETGDFSDVTLVSEDRKQFRAHRNILAASSPIFRDLLQIQQGNQAVFFLKGVQGSDLESVLQFLYFGEATLYENRINAFLNVSNILEIKEFFKSINGKDVFPVAVDKEPPTPADIMKEQLQSVEDSYSTKMESVNPETLPVSADKEPQTKADVEKEQLKSVDYFPQNSKIELGKPVNEVEPLQKP